MKIGNIYPLFAMKRLYFKSLLLLLLITPIVISCACKHTNSRSDYIDTANSVIKEDSYAQTTKTYYYNDFFDHEYCIILSEGVAIGRPSSDPEELESLGDILRHQVYLDPLKGYYRKGSSGCEYEVIFNEDTYYICNDGYIYTSYSAAQSRNHNQGFKITHTD